MAVVVSQEQNEIQTFQKWGLDIKYHREKMEKWELDKEFKDPENPLRWYSYAPCGSPALM